MTRHHIIVLKFLHSKHKFFKFKMTITFYTRVRCSALFIGFDEIIYYLFFEFILKIKDIIRHTEFSGYCSCVLYIIKRTASLFPADTYILIIVEFHRCADALISVLFHKKSGDARINTATHSNYSFFHN